MTNLESDREHFKLQYPDYAEGITERKIKKIEFMHKGKLLVFEVGKPSPYNDIPVRAIYEDGNTHCYLIWAGDVTFGDKSAHVEEIDREGG